MSTRLISGPPAPGSLGVLAALAGLGAGLAIGAQYVSDRGVPGAAALQDALDTLSLTKRSWFGLARKDGDIDNENAGNEQGQDQEQEQDQDQQDAAHEQDMSVFHTHPDVRCVARNIPTSASGLSESKANDKDKKNKGAILECELFELSRTNTKRGTTTRTVHVLPSGKSAERDLSAEQASFRVKRAGNPVVRFDSNVLSAKETCEDRIAYDIVDARDLAVLSGAVDVIATAVARGASAVLNSDDESNVVLPGQVKTGFWRRWRDVRTALFPDSMPSLRLGPAPQGSSIELRQHRGRIVPKREYNPGSEHEDEHEQDVASNGGRGSGRHEDCDDVMLFSVFDGHTPPYGWIIADLLRRSWHALVCASLGAPGGVLVPGKMCSRREGDEEGLAGDYSDLNIWKERFTGLITETFKAWDADLHLAPSSLLSGAMDRLPNTPATLAASPAGMTLGLPGTAGAAALTVLVDARTGTLAVASLGDCKAVAGWHDGGGGGGGVDDGNGSGIWRCDTLTWEMLVRNPEESARSETLRSSILSEHPREEGYAVDPHDGWDRLLGGLMPSRVFGDRNYNMTGAEYEDQVRYTGEHYRRCPFQPISPPYVSKTPQVAFRQLYPQDQDGGHKDKTGGSTDKPRFVVIATDGLWDLLTCEEAALLMAAWIEEQEGTLRQRLRSGARGEDAGDADANAAAKLDSGVVAESASIPDELQDSAEAEAAKGVDVDINNIPKATLAAQIPFVHPEDLSSRPWPAEPLPETAERTGSGHTHWAVRDDNAATHLIRNALGGADEMRLRRAMGAKGALRDDISVIVVFFDEDGKPIGK